MYILFVHIDIYFMLPIICHQWSLFIENCDNNGNKGIIMEGWNKYMNVYEIIN